MLTDSLISRLESIDEISYSIIRGVAYELERRTPCNRGAAPTESYEQLNQYINLYWPLHLEKLNDAFKVLFFKKHESFKNKVDIIDWGCGQGIASFSYIDYLKNKKFAPNIASLTLIDQSKNSLNRAEYFCRRIHGEDLKINCIVSDLNKLDPKEIPQSNSPITIHLFSNILDVEGLDIAHIAKCVEAANGKRNLIISVSPFIYEKRNAALGVFKTYFKDQYKNRFQDISYRKCRKHGECKKCNPYFQSKLCSQIFLESRFARHEMIYEFYLPEEPVPKIIDYPDYVLLESEPIDYAYYENYSYAAYALDPIITNSKYHDVREYVKSISRFSIKSNCIDEKKTSTRESIFAVLSNHILRGIPTLMPIDQAEKYSKAGGIMMKLEPKYGAIRYDFRDEWPVYAGNLSDEQKYILHWGVYFARIQLSIIRYLMYLEAEDVEIWIKALGFDETIVCEAIASLNIMIKNIAVLSDFEPITIRYYQENSEHEPKSILTIQNGSINIEEDLSSKSNLIVLSDYEDSYASFYTKKHFSASLLKYKLPKIGSTDEYESTYQDALTYFLQNLFRKERFIAGQLDILQHSLGDGSVIGLLPTGGGKSLLYQLSVLMQPGFALVIEPLKSLMKDQYDEMKILGIDSIYVSSDFSPKERQMVEWRMKSGESLFTLISPERLQIQTFRDSLQDMVADRNFFSYFVVDEAHCVSEWGHDFRPSYLSLAKNANKFCKPIDGDDISVIGLTATASFDVLTDIQVELEISSNKTIHVVKSQTLKREEIVYKFVKTPDFDNSAKLKNKEIYKNKRDELIRLIGEDLVKDYNQAYQNPETREIHRLKFEEESITINNETGIIVFCPHKTSGLGVSTKYESNKGVYDLLNEVFEDDDRFNIGYFRGDEYFNDQNRALMNEYQREFKADKINIMVATKAFGMGFNKPNIRYSIHLNYPGSIESFAQETGRVGRDRKLSLAYTICSQKDIDIPNYLLNSNYMEKEDEMDLTQSILKYKDQLTGKSIEDCLSQKHWGREHSIKIIPQSASFIKHLTPLKHRKYLYLNSRYDDNKFLKVIYRLALMGFIDDYTIRYTYKENEFTIKIGSQKKPRLGEVLKKYLMRYHTEKKANMMVAEFSKSCNNNPQFKDIIGYYIDFEHNFFKKKREQAMNDMDFACRYGLDNQDSDPLSDNFRDYIDVYFSSKYFRENYVTSYGKEASLTGMSDRGKIQSEEMVKDFIEVLKKDDGGLIPNCKELRGACIRLLNDNPFNYSLHLLNAFTNFIISRKKKLEFNQGIKELLKGIELYIQSENVPMNYIRYSSFTDSFYKEINEEMPDFNEHIKKISGYDWEELLLLCYYFGSAEIILKTIGG